MVLRGDAARAFVRHIGKEIYDADDQDKSERGLRDVSFVLAHEFTRP